MSTTQEKYKNSVKTYQFKSESLPEYLLKTYLYCMCLLPLVSCLCLFTISQLRLINGGHNCLLCISQFQARSSPPRATPGHLTPVRLHIVGHLTRIETRPIGHVTRRKNAGQRSHKLSECFIHSQNLLVYFASNSF